MMDPMHFLEVMQQELGASAEAHGTDAENAAAERRRRSKVHLRMVGTEGSHSS